MEKIDDSGNPVSENGKLVKGGWNWDDTRVFLAVARHGTLSGAAAELNLGIATLSRRVERLEKALNLPLFVRQQTGYQLTDDGELLVAKAEALEGAAASFSSEVASHAQASGKVRLATAENLATLLILPALPEFQRQYPGISIELLTDIHTVNLHRRDADLALRMVKPERGNVSLRRLGTLGYGVYCSEDYADAHRSSLDTKTYEALAFVSWSDMQLHLPAAQWVERVLAGRDPVLTATSLACHVAAAKAGLGLVVLPHIIGNKVGLVCVESCQEVNQPIYLVIQSDLRQSPRMRAVADFLVDLVMANRDRLSG